MFQVDAMKKIKNKHRQRLILSHIPKRRNNHSVTNDKPHQLKNYRENIGLKRPSQYGRTGMDQLNVQQTWPPVQGLEKQAGTCTIDFILR